MNGSHQSGKALGLTGVVMIEYTVRIVVTEVPSGCQLPTNFLMVNTQDAHLLRPYANTVSGN